MIKNIVKDVVYFGITLAPFIYVVFWMNANPWWMALGSFLFIYTHKQASEEMESSNNQKCCRKSCCKQDPE